MDSGIFTGGDDVVGDATKLLEILKKRQPRDADEDLEMGDAFAGKTGYGQGPVNDPFDTKSGMVREQTNVEVEEMLLGNGGSIGKILTLESENGTSPIGEGKAGMDIPSMFEFKIGDLPSNRIANQSRMSKTGSARIMTNVRDEGQDKFLKQSKSRVTLDFDQYFDVSKGRDDSASRVYGLDAIKGNLGMDELGMGQLLMTGKRVETARYSGNDELAERNIPLLSTKSVTLTGGGGTKYRIMSIGDLLESRNKNVCFGLIGHGPTFCIRKDCMTSHIGAKLNLDLNTICVVKINDVSLFCEPTVQLDQVEPKLLSHWLNEKLTIEEWTERFALAGSSKEMLNKEGMKESVALKEVAKNFKSPIKFTQEATDRKFDEMIALVDTDEFYDQKINTAEDVDK
jgi:hypothetical protein